MNESTYKVLVKSGRWELRHVKTARKWLKEVWALYKDGKETVAYSSKRDGMMAFTFYSEEFK